MATAHVLIADITGSTSLYDRLTDQEALAQVSIILAQMRNMIEENGGHCVKSQGDDTLSFFSEADQAFAAARAMIEADWGDGLGVHAGIHFGEVLSQDSDIYGDAVNTAARLASLAKTSELLLGDTVFAQLGEATRMLCVSMGALKLKGKREATQVHSFAVSDLKTQTVLFGSGESLLGPRTESAALSCVSEEWNLSDGESVAVGRSSDCQAILDHPWVSRKHGFFELRAAQLEYTDHSSSGSTIITSDGQEFSLQRRSMLLSGEGLVLVGTRDRSMTGSIIRYSTNDLKFE
ncbi:FHA domain-containing protein [Sulfitobacter sp. F26204]|uniref:adenylate/guanylate cyclase domain-containing protein n=1 Tax=Sulfitobacter sp. F26204 TaxID=2996014 RepID=UPI00225E39BB|nr:adenylate/guanylate cyclase domain-containing protein [Sulfitobacter sp. F26204]MCX7558951.1 FHA domain-containing protein [Sulfitobacter sp. F26204]